MILLECGIVAIVLLLALIYLARTFWPKSKRSCGCGNTTCKVSKPKLK